MSPKTQATTKAETEAEARSGKSMFIKHPKPEMKGKDDEFAGIFARDVHYHSEEPNEYGDGAVQEQVGTIVPVSKREGGIQKKKNRYGKVVVGNRITKGAETPLDVSNLEATEIQEATGNAHVSMPGSTADPSPVEHVSDGVPEHTTLEQPALMQVIFEGKFGSFKGTYKTVFRQNGMFIAVYDLAEAVYTPPVSDEPFSIKTSGYDCQVVHMGICFEMELFNCGFQIFVIKD